MAVAAAEGSLCFGAFQFDQTTLKLSKNGVPIRLGQQPSQVLATLLERRGEIVTREELRQRLWGVDVFVDFDHGLNKSVQKLRDALNDSAGLPLYIETVPRIGYRFIAPVQSPAQTLPATLPAAPATDPEHAIHAVAGPEHAIHHPFLWRHRIGQILVAGCILLAASLALRLFGSRWISKQPIRSLAVLPLNNLSGDPTQEYFADGMTDELITELARIPNLRVVSRTSVMAEKGSRRPLPDIARQLDVNAVVEGSIVRSGDRIRITAQLIDARTDRHLWAESFEGPASDVLSLQDSVAQQIASQARLVLSPFSPRAPVNPAAHDAYLRGRYFFHKQDFSHSLDSFQQAIDLDYHYASAHAGYASALDGAATFGIGTPEQLMPKALAAAQRAIQLDPQNGEAYTALGSVETIYEWNWTAAGQNFTRGISLNPSDSIAEFKYAVYLDALGRPQEAVTAMRRAAQLDPLSFLINRRLGATLYLARQYDAAIAQLQRAAEMEQRAGSIDNYMSLIYEQKGEHDEAVQHDLLALHENQPKLDTAALLSVYRQRGWQPYWRARTSALLLNSKGPCTAYEIGVDDLRVNELNRAFDTFQHAIDTHCFNMALIRVDPLFDSVRHDSRYAALLARMHQ